MNSPGSPPAEECYYDRSSSAAASSWRRLNNTDDSIRRRSASKDGLVSGGGDDERAFRNLLEIDDQDLSASSYFSFQTDLRPYMRKMVVIWMLEVCEDQSIEDETFWIAVNYFDRILSVLPIRKSQLQLVASACLFIASKLNNNEGASPSTFIKASRLVTYTDFSITVDELLEWELTTLQALKWNVLVATPYDFLRRFVVCLPLAADDDDDDSDRRRSVERHATTLIALSATDVKFVVYPASMLASGCLCAAAKELFGIDWVTGVRLYQRLQQYTSVETDCLVTCQEQIEDLVKLSLEEAAAADARQQQQEEDEETEEETEEDEEENSSSSSLTRSAIKQSSSSKASMAPTTPTDVREISVNCGGGGAGFERHK